MKKKITEAYVELVERTEADHCSGNYIPEIAKQLEKDGTCLEEHRRTYTIWNDIGTGERIVVNVLEVYSGGDFQYGSTTLDIYHNSKIINRKIFRK